MSQFSESCRDCFDEVEPCQTLEHEFSHAQHATLASSNSGYSLFVEKTAASCKRACKKHAGCTDSIQSFVDAAMGK